ATFSISLPLAVTKHTNESRRHPTATPPLSTWDCDEVSLEGITVLVVDDEPDARELIGRLLTECKATVVEAESAGSGREQLKRVHPDVLVSDIGMPKKDGYEFIREVRGLPADEGGRTPAVALTAFARSEDRTRAMLAGYQVHISKPVEPQELIVTVASIV